MPSSRVWNAGICSEDYNHTHRTKAHRNLNDGGIFSLYVAPLGLPTTVKLGDALLYNSEQRNRKFRRVVVGNLHRI